MAKIFHNTQTAAAARAKSVFACSLSLSLSGAYMGRMTKRRIKNDGMQGFFLSKGGDGGLFNLVVTVTKL